MEIISKYVQGSNLLLNFSDDLPYGTQVVVKINNAENHKQNIADGKFDYVYSSDNGNAISISNRTIKIEIDSAASALLFVEVSIDSTKYSTIFLNDYMLFKAQNRYLAKLDYNCTNGCCDACGEKKNRTELMTILLRTRLLDYSYANGLIDDSVQFYTDLSRILDFSEIVFESIPQFYNNIDDYATTLF